MFRVTTFCLATMCLVLTACEKTTVEGPANQKLTLVKPMDATIRQGESEKMTIVIARTNMTGPINVTFADLPKGVKVVDDQNKIEGTERTFVLEASADADLVTDSSASVTATGPNGLAATERFKVSVKPKA